MKKLLLLFVALSVAVLADAATYSGTLPVVFINTVNSAPVNSKENYVDATFYIDAMNSGLESVGSATDQLATQIRGRGNYTWTGFDKKPYKLKLGKKTALLGMKKNKHFALLAHADDDLGFLRNTVGFEISRRLGLDWTPSQQPVEVVLNGEYLGLYMLTETIRVDSNRVDITEQADNETIAENITGGWLVEIDNYDDDAQVTLTEGNGEKIRLTYHTPEVLSDVQKTYLQNLGQAIDDAIYATDKNSTEWQNLIDIDALAKFYVVQEVMDNAESFHGSCYFTKERGEDTKIKFGPVWDFGNAYHRSADRFIYQDSPFGQTWIGELAKFPAFQTRVSEVWYQYLTKVNGTLDSFINSFISEIASASVNNASRWPNYGNGDIQSSKNNFLNNFHNKVNWLRSQWGEGSVSMIDGVAKVTMTVNGTAVRFSQNVSDVVVSDIMGRRVNAVQTADNAIEVNAPSGVYIVGYTCADKRAAQKIVIQR